MDTIIGIDLGTTNCTVTAIDEDGKTLVVKNNQNEFLTPSAVYFCKNKNEFIVGKKAKEKSNIDPENLVLYVKREMGKDKDKVRFNPITEKYNPYNFWGKTFSPQDISAIILKQLKHDAEKELGKEIDKAVITCPAYFGDNEKNATKLAGQMAGFDVLEIIPEPTAAALSYCSISKKERETILVFDLGGGTFDVTILKIQNGENGREVETVATDGNHKLGGIDWDSSIIDYMIDRFEMRYPDADIDFGPKKDKEITYGKLRIEVEKAKVALFKEGIESVPITIEYGGQKHTENLSRSLYAEKTQKWTDQCRIYCNNILSEQGLTWDNIDTVLMIGNMSNCTTIRDSLKKWSGKEINFGLINPKTCVSEGAAIKGYLLEGGDKVKVLGENIKPDYATFEQTKEEIEKADELQNNSQREVVTFNCQKIKSGVIPLSIGIKVINNKTGQDVIYKFFKKNSSYPISFTHAFPPNRDGDENLTIDVYEGEGETPETCKLLGSAIVQLDGKLTRQDKLDITLSKDNDGILQIEAKNQKTNVFMKAEIKRENSLSESEVKKAIEEFEEFSLG
ncbi:Hsp70 family protein [Treponema bryantii]|uniref:Hsp70 family protein n=1 Tax=Treponema bryantii TaxID=163 RepID=UPI0003B66128|nr:Hsp70 family protein [Treponema bryantii]